MRKVFLVVMLVLAPLAGAAANDPAEIRALIARTYDKPTAKVETRPVTVVGDYAVASWRQGERGGRALLLKKQGQWAVQLCSGKALRTVDGLVASRVPRAVAEEMSRQVDAAESALSTGERARFDSFGEAQSSHHPMH